MQGCWGPQGPPLGQEGRGGATLAFSPAAAAAAGAAGPSPSSSPYGGRSRGGEGGGAEAVGGERAWQAACLWHYAKAARVAYLECGGGMLDPLYLLHSARLKMLLQLKPLLQPACVVSELQAAGRVVEEVGGVLRLVGRYCFLPETVRRLHPAVLPADTLPPLLPLSQQAQARGCLADGLATAATAGEPAAASCTSSAGCGSGSSRVPGLAVAAPAPTTSLPPTAQQAAAAAVAAPTASPPTTTTSNHNTSSSATPPLTALAPEHLPPAELHRLLLDDSMSAMQWCIDRYRQAGGGGGTQSTHHYHRAHYQLARAAKALGHEEVVGSQLAVLFVPPLKGGGGGAGGKGKAGAGAGAAGRFGINIAITTSDGWDTKTARRRKGGGMCACVCTRGGRGGGWGACMFGGTGRDLRGLGVQVGTHEVWGYR